MKKTAKPFTQRWPVNLTGRELWNAFFDAAEWCISNAIVSKPHRETASAHTAIWQYSGTIVELRGAIPDEEIDQVNLLSLSLNPPASPSTGFAPARSSNRTSISLNFDKTSKSATLTITNPRNLATCEELAAEIRGLLPNDEPEPGNTTFSLPTPPAVQESIRRLAPNVQIDCYRLVKRLGAGFSSEVWMAEVLTPPVGTDLKPGQIVAMKHYYPSQTYGLDSLRIQREFKVASDLRHRNLVSVYDLVLSPSRPFHTFLTMEYIKGKTLKEMIPKGGFQWGDCVKIGIQLGEAISELHHYGALHRDVKPANIIVAPNGHLDVKLLDFGIVSLSSEKGHTEASALLGSKHTSAPEQLFGEEIDTRADIYALGATLYQCYTGTPLYDSAGPVTAVVRAILEKPQRCTPKTNSSEKTEVEFVEFVNNCLEREPSNRPSTADICLDILKKLSGESRVFYKFA